MKPALSAILSVILACGLASALSYQFGARGQTLAIIAIVTSVVSGTTAYLAAAATAPFGISVEKPSDKPWGMRDFPLIDPSGVLWRIGERLAEPHAEPLGTSPPHPNPLPPGERGPERCESGRTGGWRRHRGC